MKFHYFKQQWLKTPRYRLRQIFHFYRPSWRKGIGVVIFAHEFSISWADKKEIPFDYSIKHIESQVNP